MKRLYSLLGVFSVILLLAVVVGGCGTRGEQPVAELRPAAGGRNYGGIFRVNETGELRSLDPVRINDATSSHIAEQVYDRLVTLDENLELRPDLAERFEISPDGKVITYYLRRGVYFHDAACFPDGKGREMTAEDVRYSFTRVCDFRTGTLGFDYFNGKLEGAAEYFEATKRAAKGGELSPADVSGLVVVDKYTIQFRLTQPFAPFEYYPALSQCFIHPKEAVEHFGAEFFKNPVGTGPFIFSSWQPDRQLVLVRNAKYWRSDEHGNQLPYLDSVRFTFMKDDKLQLLEFRQGNLDESYRIPSEFFGEIVSGDKKPVGDYEKYVLLSVPAMSSQFYGLMTQSDVFKDVRVRQAFSYAIDRERIIKFVLKGQANAPAHNGIVPPSMPGYRSDLIKGYSYDRDKARKLLAEAGYPDGKGFPELTLQLNAGGGRNLQIAEAVQSMLQEVLNISVSIKQVEWATHLETVDAGGVSFFRFGWIADYPEPDNFLNLFYGKMVPKDGGISPINSTRYINPVFDSLYELGLTTMDREQRMELYRKAEQIAMNEAPVMLTFYDEDYRFLQPWVRGYRNNAMDRRPYKFVWFDYSGN